MKQRIFFEIEKMAHDFLPRTDRVAQADDCYRCRDCDTICEVVHDQYTGRQMYGCPACDGGKYE